MKAAIVKSGLIDKGFLFAVCSIVIAFAECCCK